MHFLSLVAASSGTSAQHFEIWAKKLLEQIEIWSPEGQSPNSALHLFSFPSNSDLRHLWTAGHVHHYTVWTLQYLHWDAANMQCSSFSNSLHIAALPAMSGLLKCHKKIRMYRQQPPVSCFWLSSAPFGQVACSIPPPQHPQYQSSNTLPVSWERTLPQFSSCPNFPR